MLRPDTLALTGLLALLSGMMALSVDMSLPALPEMAQVLNASPIQVQTTISAYFVGGAIATIVYGPLSDRFGRRPLLLSGLIIYSIGSAICAAAPNVEILIGGRVLQALGPSGTAVVARAIVRDMYEGARIGRQLSLMSTVMSLFPICAPPLGGVLQITFGWRANFAVMFGVGVLALLITFTMLQETIRVRTKSLSTGEIARTYGSMLANQSYNAYVALMTLAFVGLVGWIFAAPFILQQVYGLSPFAFSMTFIIATVGFPIGATIAARYVVRLGIDRIIGGGATVCTCAGLFMVMLVYTGLASPISLAVTMCCFMMGMGGVFPQSIAGLLAPFHDRAGAASSLAEFMRQTVGAIGGIAIGSIVGASPLSLAVLVAMSGLSTLAVWYLTRGIRAGAAH